MLREFSFFGKIFFQFYLGLFSGLVFLQGLGFLFLGSVFRGR